MLPWNDQTSIRICIRHNHLIISHITCFIIYKWKLSHAYIKSKYGYKWQTFIYSLVLFLWVSKCSIIISCQSFIWLMEFSNPSSTWWNTIPRCMDLLTWRWWMFDPTPWRSDVAWLHNLTLAPVYTPWWSWPLFHASRLGLDPWVWMKLLTHQHYQNNYLHPLS